MASQTIAQQSIFGRVRMGYTLVESRRGDEWYRFAQEALGMHVQRDAGALACQLDKHARRIIVVDGPAEDIGALGYQLDDEATLQVVLQRLREGSVYGDGSKLSRCSSARTVLRMWASWAVSSASISRARAASIIATCSPWISRSPRSTRAMMR